MPVGQGMWPAIWMLPNAYGAGGAYGNWPASGEIDIAEVSVCDSPLYCSIVEVTSTGCIYIYI
jgi:beta-glucanase (GH16 family)